MQTIEPGLPNITGSFYQDNEGEFGLTGAFYTYTHNGRINIKETSYSNSGYIWFDASKSNPIYGASDTVQPPAYTVYYIIKMA